MNEPSYGKCDHRFVIWNSRCFRVGSNQGLRSLHRISIPLSSTGMNSIAQVRIPRNETGNSAIKFPDYSCKILSSKANCNGIYHMGLVPTTVMFEGVVSRDHQTNRSSGPFPVCSIRRARFVPSYLCCCQDRICCQSQLRSSGWRSYLHFMFTLHSITSASLACPRSDSLPLPDQHHKLFAGSRYAGKRPSGFNESHIIMSSLHFKMP
jgi:hypothetical protein